MDITELEKVVQILQKNDVTDFEMEREGVKIKLSRTAAGSSGGYVVHSAPSSEGGAAQVANLQQTLSAQPVSESQGESSGDEFPAHFVTVESPIVGTFYRKPSPDSSPFSSEGDSVTKGSTLCIVEAMKLMNEIPAPCDGKIVKVLIKDSQVVEYGEPMFVIEPS